jgi:hypothetical protein
MNGFPEQRVDASVPHKAVESIGDAKRAVGEGVDDRLNCKAVRKLGATAPMAPDSPNVFVRS